MNEMLWPSLLRCAEKLNVAPPKCSSCPTMSQSTSPILMTFTRNPRSPRPTCARRLEILAQYTLLSSVDEVSAGSLCRVRFRQRHDFQRTLKLIDGCGGLESNRGRFSRKQIKIVVRGFNVEIAEGNIDAASQLRCTQAHLVGCTGPLDTSFDLGRDRQFQVVGHVEKNEVSVQFLAGGHFRS